MLDLLDVEREAEKKENLSAVRRLPLQTREALGKTVADLSFEDLGAGFSGMPLLRLKKGRKLGDLSPFHAMASGDNVLVTFPRGLHPTEGEGTIYSVSGDEVTVALGGPPPVGLERARGGRYQIDRLGSDATYRRMKEALEAVLASRRSALSALREISLGQKKSGLRRARVEFFNDGLNEFQRQAVAAAMGSKDFALVHGPPGTGKTTVLVEIIAQEAARGGRVLATAPSNIAVDNILEKLDALGLDVVRLGHPARTLESLRRHNLSALVEADPAYAEVRALDEERERMARRGSRFGRGQMGWDEQKDRDREIKGLWHKARRLEAAIGRRRAASAQVVLATHAGLSEKLVSGAFDLAALDEASQATEPLSWIALRFAERAVLAGDARQLPPTIYSEEAAKGGLSVTLFDRLIAILPKSHQTLLRVQYRMHEEIMEFPSREFYEGALVADESVKGALACGLPDVASTELTSSPFFFVDTAGAGFSESWNELLESRENAGEARLAAQLAGELLKAGLSPRQMALITPYVAQARLLKALVKDSGIEAGSVDGFQGREKEAVIISLVRSNEKGEIGFLKDVRRLNVAITRARRLLIVIGDSATIGRHPIYSRFIDRADALDRHRSSFEWTAPQP